MKRWLLVRHGEVETPDAYYGRTDVPLSAKGRLQARALRSRMPPSDSATFITSPLSRALDSAREALPAATELQIDPDLREVDFGDWEGGEFRDLYRRDPGIFRRWSRGDTDFEFPGGERMSDFVARVDAALARAATAPTPTPTLVLFSHGGPLRLAACRLSARPLGAMAEVEIERGGLLIVDQTASGDGLMESVRTTTTGPGGLA